MHDLKDKVFIVTGAGSGMGRELTLLLVKKGIKVAGCDINEQTIAETKSLISDQRLIKTYVLDVADEEKVALFAKTVKEDFNGLHGIINNAGIIQPFMNFMKLSDTTVKRVMNINFYSVINLTRAVLKEVDPNDDTYIVNISSMGGFLPVPGQGIYGASKAGVKLFTEALYAETKDSNVHVSVVFPGAIATNITENSKADKDEKSVSAKEGAQLKTTPADVAAKIIVEGIEKGKLKIFVGKDSKMMDILYRLMPIKSIDMMTNMINKMISW